MFKQNPQPRTRSQARAPEALQFAIQERRFANEFASLLWQQLRDRKVAGLKFRREFPIPPYTADFACLELKLVIEVDGAGHLTEQGIARDQHRDQFLAAQGYRVLRINGYQITKHLPDVLQRIQTFIQEVQLERQASPPSQQTSPVP